MTFRQIKNTNTRLISIRWNSTMKELKNTPVPEVLEKGLLIALRQTPTKILFKNYFLYKNNIKHIEKRLPANLTFSKLNLFLAQHYPTHLASLQESKDHEEFERKFFGINGNDWDEKRSLYKLRHLSLPLLIKYLMYRTKKSSGARENYLFGIAIPDIRLKDIRKFIQLTYPEHYKIIETIGVYDETTNTYREWSYNNFDSQMQNFWRVYNFTDQMIPIIRSIYDI